MRVTINYIFDHEGRAYQGKVTELTPGVPALNEESKFCAIASLAIYHALGSNYGFMYMQNKFGTEKPSIYRLMRDGFDFKVLTCNVEIV